MSKKRTREQKKRAQVLRIAPRSAASETAEQRSTLMKYSFATSEAKTTKSMPQVLSGETAQYVLTDLLKTASTAAVLFIVLVGIYLYLRYN